ncbi:hypothetical protein, partial [Microcystis aeruginosa]|uniref:hypothetical protein n=1 Tax=Microcystis aeruginosa TaxID=1126 RepID=UPI001C0FFD60
GASHFCKSTNLGFFKGNFLLKLGVLLSVLSLNPSFWGIEPPKPPVGGVAPPPNPGAHQLFGGMLTRDCSYFGVVKLKDAPNQHRSIASFLF